MSLHRFGLALLALVYSGPALAQTATNTFDVTITIAADCQVTATQPLNFGTSGVLTAVINQTSTLEVTCTTGTPYSIGLSAGAAVGGTTALRGMTSPAANIITYQMFRNVGRTLNWGNTAPTDTVASVGTGSAQPFTVYGRVPVQSTPATGVYTDTVTTTVTF